MKKIILAATSALLFVSVNVFAEEHLDEAIKHASAAAQASGSATVLEHAVPALEHATAGSLIARGVARTHADEGVKALENAIAKAKAKKDSEATASAQAAVQHLKAANNSKK